MRDTEAFSRISAFQQSVLTTMWVTALLLVSLEARPCSKVPDWCGPYLGVIPSLTTRTEGEPISGKDQRKALKRAAKEYGKGFLGAYATCLLEGPETVDVSQIEKVLMRAKPNEPVARLLDLNQLRSSSAEEQTQILNPTLAGGTAKLWRGYVVQRDEAYRLVSVLGLKSLQPIMNQACEEHSPKHLDCAHFKTLQALFPVPGPYEVRANAFISELQSYSPGDFAELVHNSRTFETAVAWGIGEVCPNRRSWYTDICERIRLTVCMAADARYPQHPPGEHYPQSRGPLDDLASQVTPSCETPCPSRYPESDAKPPCIPDRAIFNDPQP